MTGMSGVIPKLYSILLHLYPASFRGEFEEQMLLDFSDMALDAKSKGTFHFLLFCLRELVEYPVNLLSVHLKEGLISRVLRSQPVNHGLHSALGFGIALAGLTIATWSIRDWLFSTFEPANPSLPLWYYKVLQDYDSSLLFLNVLEFISTALASVIFGVLLALLMGKRSKYSNYFLAGTLGWLIPGAIFKFLLCEPFNSDVSLSPQKNIYLGMVIPILQGAFLGAMFNLAGNGRTVTLRRFILGLVLYPAVTYMYIGALIHFDLNSSPEAFASVMTLLALFLVSVIVAVMISDRRMPWMVVAAAIGYPVLSHAGMFIARLLHLPLPEPGMGISEASPFILQVSGVTQQVIFGVMFGLILGVILGLQRRNIPSPMLT